MMKNITALLWLLGWPLIWSYISTHHQVPIGLHFFSCGAWIFFAFLLKIELGADEEHTND